MDKMIEMTKKNYNYRGQCHLDKETRNVVKEKRREPLPKPSALFSGFEIKNS